MSKNGDRFEVTVPFVTARRFVGESPSRLIDDAALHVMERVFEAPQDQLPDYAFCPEVTYRRVKVEVRLEGVTWKGALGVVLRRWPDDGFLRATIPRLDTQRFAIASTKSLAATVRAVLERRITELPKADREAASHRLVAALHGAKPPGPEHLDLVEVDLELPTVLPRTVAAKKKRGRADDAEAAEMDRAKRRRQTPPHTLREVGDNLVHRALDGDTPKIVGRDALVDRVRARVAKPGAAVLLVGEAGVGKGAIMEEVVARITRDEPRLHARTDAWRVDANRIIAGMSVVGQWEARVAQMVEELSAREDLLVVDDLASLVFAGRTYDGNTNVAGYLEPHLAQGELRVLASCTEARLEATREMAPGFFAQFDVIRVPPLDEATTLRALVARVRDLEARGIRTGARVRVASDVPDAVVALSRRFAARRALPGRAIELLERLAAESPGGEPDALGRRRLDRDSLVDLFASQTGLPRRYLWPEEPRSTKKAADTHDALAHFEDRVVAQPAASRAAADVVALLGAGMNDPLKPVASLLLVGPTGVGKTETAKALAAYLFGDPRRMIRFDMSELGEPGSAARLFGDARRPDGELTRRVRQRPFSVVLFDEIEKAHAGVFDALLGVLGEGRLTSADGRTTDFTNTVILMTSNLGVRDAEATVGFEGDTLPDRSATYVAAARAFFRPELFNRIDRVVAYRPLGRDALRPLVERALSEVVSRRGLRRSGVLVEVEEEVVELMIERGFDPKYGARALRRAVEQQLVVPLARRLARAPADRTTRVSLHRAGDGVGLEVWALEERAAVEREPPTVDSYAALSARVARLRAQITEAAPRFEALREERARVVARISDGSIDEAEWPRADALNDFASSLESQTAELAALDEMVGEVTFDARVEVEWIEGDWFSKRPQTAVRETPTYRAGAKPSRREVTAVEESELGVAELRWRAAALERPRERRLVRMLPATRAPESAELASWLAWTTLRLLGDFGATASLLEHDGARWTEKAEPRARGWAIAAEGYGLDALLDGEVGFHASVRHEGPDVRTGLARVEVVEAAAMAAGERAPGLEADLARLEALDAELAAFEEARRRGKAGAHPRGPLPIVRRMVDGLGVDPDSGVAVRAKDLESLKRAMRTRLAQREG